MSVVIILGMHRSGTSCLTGLLQQEGLQLGSVSTTAPYNPKGNRENAKIMLLNDEIIAHNNGMWDRPPSSIVWTTEHRHRRDEIINEYKQYEHWGFKDPRTLFTLPFWLEGLKKFDVKYIGTFRHPLSVAKSLVARQKNLSLKEGIEIWNIYNRKLLSCYRNQEFPLLCFDLPSDRYLENFMSAFRKLNLPVVKNQENLDFYQPSLINQNPYNQINCDDLENELEAALQIYSKLYEKYDIFFE